MKLIILLSLDQMNELIGAKLRFRRLPLEEHDRGFAGLNGFSGRTMTSCSAGCILNIPDIRTQTLKHSCGV